MPSWEPSDEAKKYMEQQRVTDEWTALSTVVLVAYILMFFIAMGIIWIWAL
jgi:hypothetical protein